MAPKNLLFNREVELMIIEEVKQRLLLWDTTIEEYRRTDLKRQHWNEIAVILGPPFTGELVQRRFVNMESTFRANERKVKASLARSSGKGTDEIYTPTWEYFSLLAFLRKTCVQGESRDSFSFVRTEPTPVQNECLVLPLNFYFDETLKKYVMIPSDVSTEECSVGLGGAGAPSAEMPLLQQYLLLLHLRLVLHRHLVQHHRVVVHHP